MTDLSCVIESRYGKVVSRLRFTGIRCDKNFFMRNDGTTDMDNIRRYGLAIAATEQIIAHPDWLFTDEDYVVSGVTARKVQTKNVIINVDESVERLSMLALKIIRGGIKPHFAIFRMVFADYHDVSSR